MPDRTLGLRAYRAVTAASAPALEVLLARRLGRGKEIAGRLAERRGLSTRDRPAGPLVWLHAVSVGETLSAGPLIAALARRCARVPILLTTGTVTAARLAADRFDPAQVIHQFAPLDHPAWVARFLDHWRPTLGLFVESELWPNLLLTAEAKGVPLVLVNGRLSARSAQSWQRTPRTIARLLACFSLCLAQDAETAARLERLGARAVKAPGNLKDAADPLPDRPDARAALDAAMGERPRWLAASTHSGEDEQIATAHQALAQQRPGLLTLIVPRHPERGAAIAAMLAGRGLRATLRSTGALPGPQTDVYVADTLGELGVFYRLAPVAFIGGTLVDRGGQNPLEAARLGAAVLHGPYTANFATVMARLARAGASEEVSDAAALAGAVDRLMADAHARAARVRAGLTVTADAGDVLARIMTALEPFLATIEDTTRHASA